ncbi:hypothetical protein FQR65_LT18317 [Abscondita terminalis]|nr:hypothetical protein FQR65_LT18317 [Abscondita terminalis]
MIAGCIKDMFKRLSKSERDPLFDIILLWLEDEETLHRQLAAQVCGLLVSIEKTAFESRLPDLVPIILKQFENNKPGRRADFIGVQPKFVGYPHEWVRLGAAQFLGFVLSSLDVDKLSRLVLAKEVEESGYLYSAPELTIKSLTLDLCAQLQPDVKDELAEQVIKNLLFVARVLQKVPRMRRAVHVEVIKDQSSTVLRTAVFKWIAAVVTVLDLPAVVSVLHHLLAPLARELATNDEGNATLRQLAKEVGTMLKNRVGMELYTNALSKVEQRVEVKRSERKRERTQLAVTDPELYAKKKIRMNEKKKELRKRKLAQRKGKDNRAKRRRIGGPNSSEVL